MTRKKINPKINGSPHVPRRHYACRIRLDLFQQLKETCERLNCSQGVFLEVALSKVLLSDIVQPRDVFAYDPASRWYSGARDRLISGADWYGHQITDFEREKMISLFSKVINGEVPASDLISQYKKKGSGVSALLEFLTDGTEELPFLSRPALRKKDIR